MKNLPIISFILICNSLFSQNENPFRSIGKKGEIITLSNGKFQENHPYDSLQKIGSIVMNINTGKIHQILDSITLYSEATLDPTTMSRFYSIDPITARFPHNSPYAFSENRVIDAIELEGLESFEIKNKDNNQISLVLTKVDGDFIVTDYTQGEAMIHRNFVYSDFQNKMKDFTVDKVTGVLNVPGVRNEPFDAPGDAPGEPLLPDFMIRTQDKSLVKKNVLEGGLFSHDYESPESALSTFGLFVPDEYDFVQVYHSPDFKKEDVLKALEKQGVDIKNKDILFIDKPTDIVTDETEEVDEESGSQTLNVQFGKYE